MYWKFDKEFGLLPSLATYGTPAPGSHTPGANARCNSSRKVGLLCEGALFFIPAKLNYRDPLEIMMSRFV